MRNSKNETSETYPSPGLPPQFFKDGRPLKNTFVYRGDEKPEIEKEQK